MAEERLNERYRETIQELNDEVRELRSRVVELERIAAEVHYWLAKEGEFTGRQGRISDEDIAETLLER